MVRDPSIVSPSLTGVFIGGGHNKHGTGSRCTLPKQCRPPSPRRRWWCDRSSYKRSLFSRMRSITVARSSPSHCVRRPRGPRRAAARAQTLRQRCASIGEASLRLLSVSRGLCLCLPCSWVRRGSLSWFFVTRFTDLRIYGSTPLPPPSPSRDPGGPLGDP